MIVLASGSPRRGEILSMMGYAYVRDVADCDEETGDLTADKAVALLAERKAAAVSARHPGEWVLGSDTLVTLDGTPIGKPADAEDAERMLAALSGRTHTVYTGVCLMRDGEREVFVDSARVTFYPLNGEEIARYVATGEPLDKAGAYGIQGRGAALVRRIEGDFFTVMGLPAGALARRLAERQILPEN